MILETTASLGLPPLDTEKLVPVLAVIGGLALLLGRWIASRS
jgi:hypothetical protein